PDNSAPPWVHSGAQRRPPFHQHSLIAPVVDAEVAQRSNLHVKSADRLAQRFVSRRHPAFPRLKRPEDPVLQGSKQRPSLLFIKRVSFGFARSRRRFINVHQPRRITDWPARLGARTIRGGFP